MLVLLVDDNVALRRALARTIRLAGHEVAAFESGEALLAHGVPDHDACLVVDLDLPGVGGIALCERLAECGKPLPTVFITALAPEEVSAALAAAAPAPVLYKPFERKDLLEAIGQACG